MNADDLEPPSCWICGGEDITYTDVLGMAWCKPHYDGLYLA